MAEPMASALRRAAEAAGKSEFERRRSGSGDRIPQSLERGAAAAPARAKEIPAADFKNLGLEPTASAISVPSTEEIREIKRIEDPSAGDGWNSHSSSPAAQAPSFSSLDDEPGFRRGWQQEDSTGGGAVTRTGGRRLFRLDQNAVRTSPAGGAAVCGSRKLGDGRTARATCVFRSRITVPCERGCDPTRPGFERTTGTVPSSSKPSAAVVVQGPGTKTSVPAKAARGR